MQISSEILCSLWFKLAMFSFEYLIVGELKFKLITQLLRTLDQLWMLSYSLTHYHTQQHLIIDKCIFYFRPYFTYWISFVQLIVLVVGLAVYGFAPIGFTETDKEALVIIVHEIQNVFLNVSIRGTPNSHLMDTCKTDTSMRQTPGPSCSMGGWGYPVDKSLCSGYRSLFCQHLSSE